MVIQISATIFFVLFPFWYENGESDSGKGEEHLGGMEHQSPNSVQPVVTELPGPVCAGPKTIFKNTHNLRDLVVVSAADWAASFVVGLISNNKNEDLLAFWAPFLLLHLGGPGTITAFALEDNALWLRHLIAMLFQVLATAYVFLLTIPQNRLLIPGLFMFLAGIIKYAERTRALYLASMGSFRASMLKDPDPGPDYAKLMEELASTRAANPDVGLGFVNEPVAFLHPEKVGVLNELEVVQYALIYFEIFKGVIADIIFSFIERRQSRHFFLNRTPSDALKVIEVELNFFYEILFTKAVVVQQIYGVILRFISLTSVAVAFALFSHLDKEGFKKLDVRITYALLIGALALDLMSIFMTLFSDWTLASFTRGDSFVVTLFKKYLATPLLTVRGLRLSEHTKPPFVGKKKLDTPFIFRRWRESMSQFNLITYCLCERIQTKDDSTYRSLSCCSNLIHRACDTVLVRHCRRVKDFVVDFLGAKEFLDNWKYVTRQPVLEELWTFIFEELKNKTEEAIRENDNRPLCSSRGSHVLELMNNVPSDANIGELKSFIDDATFDESLMQWHIATELCYRTDSSNNSYREFSKLLSDYMLYLVMMLPTMMSAVAGIAGIRFRDTCAEAKRFFDQKELGTNWSSSDTEKACEEILRVTIAVKPREVKGDRTKSVFFDASRLAKELQKFGNEKWEMMSKVWIEMLGYAASHCRPDQHVQQVSRGGELITFVWLLMLHFGFGEHFQIRAGHLRTKVGEN